jgi:signal transduction histidine kinase
MLKPRTASRLAWSVALLSIALMLGGFALAFVDRNARVAGGSLWSASYLLSNAPILGVPVVGGVLAARRPENPIGWLFLAAGLSLGLATFGQPYGVFALKVSTTTPPAGRAWVWIGNWSWVLGIVALSFAVFLFPTGRLPSRRWRPVAWFVGGASILLTAIPLRVATQAWRDPFSAAAFEGEFGLLFVAALMVALVPPLVAVVVRFRRSRGDERLQMKWFAAGVISVVVTLVADNFSGSSWIAALSGLALLFFLGSIAIAILKYRLYEIDIVVSKAIVYGALAAFLVVVYVALVIGIGAAIGSAHNPFLTLVAAGIIALAFNPVRSRATHLANRIVYGKRATPYEVLSHFSDEMAGAYSLDDVLPRTAQMLAEGTGASRADVWLLSGSELVDEATWPAAPKLDRVSVSNGDGIEVPGASRIAMVRHQGDLLGAISIHKPPGDPVSAVEDKLLADVASQAGLVMRNVLLVEDLKASRQRLVAAQDEERRRIERNIHDGAQQQLVALAVKANLAQSVAKSDPKVEALLGQLKSEAQGALENLRDLARGIYPPLLADHGLVAALEAQAKKSAVPTDVERDGVGRYPQETEAAIYFCALEALQNVAKYSQASRATVRLSALDGHLAFAVQDDGVGFDADAAGHGTGMQGMSDRLAALGGELRITSTLGGGTLVEGRVPVTSEEIPSSQASPLR